MFANIWEYALVWIIIFSPFVLTFCVIAYFFYWRMEIFFKHMQKNFDQYLIYTREIKEMYKRANRQR